MRTGERPRAMQSGYTYLLLLFALAAGAAMLGVASERWSARVQRDRELELLARGTEIAAAIAAYRAVPGTAPQWPREFEDLLEDRRTGSVQRHLRRAYVDPYTRRADWMRVGAEQSAWQGVHSRARTPARLLPAHVAPDEVRTWQVSDHVFMAPVVAAPGIPASAPAF